MDKKNKKLSVWHQKNYYKWWRIDKLIQHIKGFLLSRISVLDMVFHTMMHIKCMIGMEK